MQRVLSVSLSHVIRTAALLLLPFSFISLIAWATAGSATGSTTDPISGAVWIWLGAHQIPFQLALPPTGLTGYFTFLPIGGVMLIFFAMRSTFNRALDRLQGDFHDINGVRIIFSVQYAILVTILAFISKSPAVTPQWYLAPIFAFFIALLTTLTAGHRVTPSRPLKIAVRILSIIIGTSLIVLAILILANFSQVEDITLSLEPGFFGGTLLLFLNILYLPNAAISLAAYFSGTGLAVGAGTLISPIWYHLGQIPVLPLLGVLPTGPHPLALLGIVFFIFLGFLLTRWALAFGITTLIQSYLFVVVGLILTSYLASGSLITSEMGAMGVSIWKFSLSVVSELAFGAVVTALILNRRVR